MYVSRVTSPGCKKCTYTIVVPEVRSWSRGLVDVVGLASYLLISRGAAWRVKGVKGSCT